jgi:hypothetical protein
VDTQFYLVAAPTEDDLHMTRMRVAMNVDKRFLDYPKERDANPLVERRCIKITIKRSLDARPACEPPDQSFKRAAKIALAEFGRIVKKGERPQLLIDVLDRVRDLLDQRIVDGRRLNDSKTCQAELQRYKKLAGRVMQLLPKPLTLIFVNFEELVEFVRSRGSGGGDGLCRRCSKRTAVRHPLEGLKFELVGHSIEPPGHSLNKVANY